MDAHPITTLYVRETQVTRRHPTSIEQLARQLAMRWPHEESDTKLHRLAQVTVSTRSRGGAEAARRATRSCWQRKNWSSGEVRIRDAPDIEIRGDLLKDLIAEFRRRAIV